MIRRDFRLLQDFVKAEIHPQPKPPLKSQPPSPSIEVQLAELIENHFASRLRFDFKPAPGLRPCDQFQVVAKDEGRGEVATPTGLEAASKPSETFALIRLNDSTTTS